jgi:hypothetical protein
MKITSVAQCSKALDFKPRSPWPERLPAFSWRGHLLSGFDRSEGHVIELSSEESLEKIWPDIYPKLTLMELARFYASVKAVDLPMEWSTFFFSYGLRFSGDFEILLQRLVTLPEAIQNWCVLKDLSTRDFSPLKAMEDWSSVLPWLQKMVTFEPSRSEGVRALEWMVDLTLMKRSLEKILSDVSNFSDWVKALRAARFPVMDEKDQQAERLVKELPWPKKLEARYIRSGDKAGFEVKLFVRNTPELHKQIEGLQAVESELERRGL